MTSHILYLFFLVTTAHKAVFGLSSEMIDTRVGMAYALVPLLGKQKSNGLNSFLTFCIIIKWLIALFVKKSSMFVLWNCSLWYFEEGNKTL